MLRRRLWQGAALLGLAAGFAQGATFILGILVARLLGRTSFGEWAILYATLLTVLNIGTAGTGFTASRMTAEFRSRGAPGLFKLLKPVLIIGVTMAFLAALGLVTASEVIATQLIGVPNLSNLVAAGAIFVALGTLAVIANGILTGMEAYKSQVVANALAIGAQLVLAVTLLPIMGIAGALVAVTVGGAIQFTLAFASVSRTAKRLPDGATLTQSNEAWHHIWAIGAPAILGGLITALSLWGVQAILSDRGGSAVFADFTAANMLRVLAVFALSLLNTSSGVLFATSIGDNQGALSQPWRLHAPVAATAVFGSLFLIVFAEPLLQLYGTDFQGAKPLLIILTLTILPEALAFNFYHELSARRKMFEPLVLAIIPRELVRFGGTILTVERFGALGAAWSFVAANFVYLAGVAAILSYGRRAAAKVK